MSRRQLPLERRIEMKKLSKKLAHPISKIKDPKNLKRLSYMRKQKEKKVEIFEKEEIN